MASSGEKKGDIIFWKEVEAQIDLKVGIFVTGDFEFPEPGRYIEIAHRPDAGQYCFQVNYKTVALDQELVPYNTEPFHMVDYDECHPTGLRGIVIKKIGQGGAL